jgi:hypothetical protein
MDNVHVIIECHWDNIGNDHYDLSCLGSFGCGSLMDHWIIPVILYQTHNEWLTYPSEK